MAKILVVEDDSLWCEVIEEALAKEKIQSETVQDGLEGLDRLKFYEYDAGILDWGLPGLNGIEVLQRYRATGGKTPLLLLTARVSLDEIEKGLDSGADDYLTKPFQERELRARVRALLRRPPVFQDPSTQYAGMLLQPANMTVQIGNQSVTLLPSEFMLLQFLMRYPDQIISADSLLNRVWKSDSESTVHALRSCIKRLRLKIEVPESKCIIANVYGRGYRLQKVTGEGDKADR